MNQGKKEIEELLNLNLQSLHSVNSTDQEIKANPGANGIGLELEAGERKIHRLWQMYENN
jgi:hypothetical protein